MSIPTTFPVYSEKYTYNRPSSFDLIEMNTDLRTSLPDNYYFFICKCDSINKNIDIYFSFALDEPKQIILENIMDYIL